MRLLGLLMLIHNPHPFCMTGVYLDAPYPVGFYDVCVDSYGPMPDRCEPWEWS